MLVSGFLALTALASAPQTERCVVLLHGLARSSASMEPLAEFLGVHGYKTFNVDYESRKHPIDTLVERVVGATVGKLETNGCTEIDFVTHSMGGILVRGYLAKHAIANLGRVVMLGPPNHGSEVVDNLKEWSLFDAINGPAGNELGTDMSGMPSKLGGVGFELGVIAGDRSINWINSTMIDGPDDGKVSVTSTKIDGMQDHIVLHVTHPMMMKDKAVMAQVLEFLRHGTFKHPSPK